MFWKDDLSKKIALQYDFFVSSVKMKYLLSKNMILFFRQKTKAGLSQKNKKKNTWKYDTFFKCVEKMVFPKKLYWNMVFLISWGSMASLFPENMIFFTDGKWKIIFLKKTWKYDVSYMLVMVVFLFPTNMKLPFCQKSKDDLFPKKKNMIFIFLLKRMIFTLEKMILAFSVLLWKTF